MGRFVPHIREWVGRHQTRLERVGLVHVTVTDDQPSKESIHVAVEGTRGFAEVIVQETGEAGLTFGTIAAPREERLELSDLAELDDFLDRFLQRAEEVAT
jgi:hypothetical protein